MPSEGLEEAWKAFRKVWDRRGYDRAVEWLSGRFSPDVNAEVLERAGRINLADVRVDQHTLRSNRRRPGAFA